MGEAGIKGAEAGKKLARIAFIQKVVHNKGSRRGASARNYRELGKEEDTGSPPLCGHRIPPVANNHKEGK